MLHANESAQMRASFRVFEFGHSYEPDVKTWEEAFSWGPFRRKAETERIDMTEQGAPFAILATTGAE